MKNFLRKIWRYFSLDEIKVHFLEKYNNRNKPSQLLVSFNDYQVNFSLFNGYMIRFFDLHIKNKSYVYEEPISAAFELICDHYNRVNFLDVGANFGFFSALVSSNPNNNSFAIELDHKFHSYLKKISASQPNSNIKIFHAGAAKQSGKICRTTISKNVRVKDQFFDIVKGPIPLINLDEFISKNNFSPNLIKIDIEGAEVGVLEGASNILNEKKSVFIVEIHPEYITENFGEDLNMIPKLFEGYCIFKFHNNRQSSYELLEIVSLENIKDHNFTIICIPKAELSLISKVHETYKVC